MRLVVAQLLMLSLLLASCAAPRPRRAEQPPERPPLPERSEPDFGRPPAPELPPTPPAPTPRRDCRHFAADASLSPGQQVLQTGLCMIERGVLVVGSCWGYANAIFERAGYPNRGTLRRTVFKGGQKGPYADIDILQPGDWVYHINLQYRRSVHSAIFVEWIDRSKKQARMLSYAGAKRRRPARLAPYDLSMIYRVVRAAR